MSFKKFWSREVLFYKGIRAGGFEWLLKPTAVRAYSSGFEDGVARVIKMLEDTAQSDPNLARRFLKKIPGIIKNRHS